MKKSKIFSLLLFFFSLMFFSELKSDSLTTVWNTGDKKAYLGKRISILEDPNKLLQISDIVSPEFQSKFVQSTVDVPGYGVTESAFWVKINIQNRAEIEKLLLLELDQPQFDEVKIYTRKSEKEPFTERVTGD
ncbi:MAG TPA: 7TM-DISM domain-containing protein, partial [Leptospiraceae bacterium]|nr:7TM-DISM domain-containing protein [Leptospiraceae bacterium]